MSGRTSSLIARCSREALVFQNPKLISALRLYQFSSVLLRRKTAQFSPAMTSKMRAIRVKSFGGPEVCQLATDVDRPTPSDNQVLVRVHYAGVNPVDTYIRSGTHSTKPALPYTPGQDCAGVVEAVGSAVEAFKVGDRVYTARTATGAYAEFTAADQQHVFPLHDSHSFAQGAAIGVPYYTAYRSLFIKAHAKSGMKVLIHGASGGVGLAATQLARAHGLKVFGTAGTSDGMKLVTDCGAHFVCCHRDPDYVEQLKAASGNGGFDVILEMLANVNLPTDLALVASNGTIVVVGNRGSVQIDPRLAMAKECSIVGVMLFCSSEGDWQEMRAAIWSAANEGWMKPTVDKEYDLGDAGSAQRDIIQSSGARGNLVLRVL